MHQQAMVPVALVLVGFRLQGDRVAGREQRLGLRSRFLREALDRRPWLARLGVSRPTILTFSSTPSTSAWIVSPSTTRITVAGTPPGMTSLDGTKWGRALGGVVAATSLAGRDVGCID